MNADFLNQLRSVQQDSGYGSNGENNYGSYGTKNVALFGGGEDTKKYLGALYNAYNNARTGRGDGPISYDDFVSKTMDFVGQMGVAEGKWTEDQYKDQSYNTNDFNAYANALVPSLFGYDATAENSYTALRGNEGSLSDDAKKAYENISKYSYQDNWSPDKVQSRHEERVKDNANLYDWAVDLTAGLGDVIGSGVATAWNSPYAIAGSREKDMETLNKAIRERDASAADILDNYSDYIAKARKAAALSNNSGESTSGSNTGTSGSAFSDDTTEGEYVTFTYKPGDTFGQKIVDLGLATDNGLWGTDGDVNFYTRQLIEQGALDENGNVKLGQTYKLRKRR